MEAAQWRKLLTVTSINRMLKQKVGALVKDSCLLVVRSGRS
jgi:hypothetical protein